MCAYLYVSTVAVKNYGTTDHEGLRNGGTERYDFNRPRSKIFDKIAIAMILNILKVFL